MASLWLKNLIKLHSILVVPPEEAFELSSGQKSRVYCDLKKTIFRADAQVSLGNDLYQATSTFQPTAFAGVVLGGCHLASLMATRDLQKNIIYVRKEAKEHGTKSLIEAPDLDPTTTRVVLLEDVTTTANSAQRALKVLQEAGLNVVGVVTVVDRREAWNYHDIEDEIGGVPFRSLFRLEELVDIYENGF